MAVALTLVSLFYLSFTFVTNKYYGKATEYATLEDGSVDSKKEMEYLNQHGSDTVWLWYTLNKCRTMEVNLGLDLKGGMNVIVEVPAGEVLRSLSQNHADPDFNAAIVAANASQIKGSTDYVSDFIKEYKQIKGQNANLSYIFDLAYDQINIDTNDAEVEKIIRADLASAIDNSFNILRNRIDGLGVSGASIRKLGRESQISVEIPGVKDPKAIEEMLQSTANLQFWLTWLDSEIYPYLMQANNIIRDSIQAGKPVVRVDVPVDTAEPVETDLAQNTEETVDNAIDSLLADTTPAEKAEEAQSLINEELFPLFAAMDRAPQGAYGTPVVAVVNESKRALIDSYLNNSQVKDLLEDYHIFLTWSAKPREGNMYELVALRGVQNDPTSNVYGPALDGDVIADARDDFQQNSPYAEVQMTMKKDAAAEWARITGENVGKSIAIVLDNKVYSYPNVNQKITGINSQITGNFTSEEAKNLANILKSGKMSVPAKIVQSEVVGPSMGQQAINQGFIAFLVALVALMIYLVVVYGFKPAMIANIALLLNLFFLLGVMASFHVVLTMSGIAGIVLSLAIAIDANVLIYERIKEELRGGKKLRAAVEEGYQKAFSAIFDANLTSILTAVILLGFGTGPIRGFAFTFLIGIIVSFFTAVFFTRLVYTIMFEKGRLKNITFTTGLTKNLLLDPKFDFLKKRKMTYTIVAVGVVIALGALFGRGLNQGIDFTGGRNYLIEFNQPVNTVEAQALLDPYFENHTPNVITVSRSNQIRISTNYGNDVDSMEFNGTKQAVDDVVKQKVYQAFSSEAGLLDGVTYAEFAHETDYIKSSSAVGASIASDIKRGAFLAVIFAVLGIGLYILIRFRDIAFSVGTIVALVLDALFILGMYALLWGFVPFSLEIDQTFIGAILTAIGYSVNDKVVIFDRVREYKALYPKSGNHELYNDALNSTLNRTFNTSFSTLLVLIIIFVFAGETIRSFSFAMILGVVFGTISSLFIATPIAHDMQKKQTGKK
ncbi:protein translocase subunit SecDF [Bacteroidales bacterium OttesenSCG-928-J19]|nr:protein translocase subunit SecDF [Bacteroidales bacterium OttesenSCG-928-J19]